MGLISTLIYTSELILCSTICVHSATRHNIHMYPYFLLAAIRHLSRVRPRSSVGRVTVDLIRRSWVRFPPRSKKIFSLPRVVTCFPLLGLTPSGLFMGLSSTIIFTSELILCSTICVHSATRHNIHICLIGFFTSLDPRMFFKYLTRSRIYSLITYSDLYQEQINSRYSSVYGQFNWKYNHKAQFRLPWRT